MTTDANIPAHGQQPIVPQPFAPPGPQQYPQLFARPAPQHYQQAPFQYPPQYLQQPFPQQGFGAPPPPQHPTPENWQAGPKVPLGLSFWIVGVGLGVLALANAVTGHGESILIFTGITALLTGLFSLVFKRPFWAALLSRKAAVVLSIAGAAALFLGSIAAGAEAIRDSAVGASATTATTIQEGTWTVGKDVAPGVYRTMDEVTDSCSWQLTRPGVRSDSSMGAVTSGFHMVKLVQGQKFETEGCGDCAKQ